MSFERDVLRFQRKAQAAMLATLKEAAQDLGEEANTSRFRGGKTPVDTSFMINSFTAAINSIPRGRGKRPNSYRATDFDSAPMVLSINRLSLGDRLSLGWTANYSKYMEARYAFMRSAAQNWPQIAGKAANRVRSAIR